MNGEMEQGEPTAETSPVQQAEAICSNYLEELSQDPKTSRNIQESITESEEPEKAAMQYARSSAGQGFTAMVVGYLGHTDVPRGERYKLLGLSEDNAAANAFRTAEDWARKARKNHDLEAYGFQVAASLEAGRRRHRADTFKQAARMS